MSPLFLPEIVTDFTVEDVCLHEDILILSRAPSLCWGTLPFFSPGMDRWLASERSHVCTVGEPRTAVCM